MVDFNLDSGKLVKNNDIDLILQQIDILFNTYPRDVLGSEDFGTKYDYYLYQLRLTGEDLKQQVLSDLQDMELFGFTPEVDVMLLQGTEQDIALIDITLIRDEEKYNKTYKIS